VQKISPVARSFMDEGLLQEDAERLIGEAAKAKIFAEEQ
jgi:hypothetical protein